MKKKIPLLIAIIVCLLLCGFSCQKKDDNEAQVERFAVATDIHLVANSLFTEENIDSYATTDKMLHLSEPIFNTIADRLIEGEYKFLLLSGDLTESGDRVSHLAVTSILKRLEEAGVAVYVINGNHDVMSNTARKAYSVTQEEFKEIYRDYGYAEAVSVLPGTLCYSADIQNRFRLIALDNIAYYTDATQSDMIPEVTTEKINWIHEQAEDAREKKLTPILLSHKGFVNHWPGLVSLISESVPDEYKFLPEDLADKGAQLGFVGHNHLNDIVSVKSDSEKTYYEVQTGSTLFCETNYRSVSYTNDTIEIDTVTLTDINLDTISPYVKKDIVAEIKDDFSGYSYKHFTEKINLTVQRNIDKILNKVNFGNETFKNILKNDIIYAAFSMPLYERDADGKTSLEQLLKAYNIVLPQTDYKSFWDIAPVIVSTLIKGNENMRNSAEITVSKYVVYSLFYHFDRQSDKIRSLCKDDYQIDVDLEKLFTEGILECYDSYLVPTIVSIALNADIGLKMQLVFASIKNNFDLISTLSDTITSLTGGVMTSIEEYFDSYSVNMEDLLERGFFDNYLNDLLIDPEPNDKTLTIDILRYEED